LSCGHRKQNCSERFALVVASALGDNSVATAGAATTVATDEQAAALFSPDEAKEFRVRWDTIQAPPSSD